MWLDAQRTKVYRALVFLPVIGTVYSSSLWWQEWCHRRDCALCSWIAGTKSTASFSTHRRNSNANVPMKKEKDFQSKKWTKRKLVRTTQVQSCLLLISRKPYIASFSRCLTHSNEAAYCNYSEAFESFSALQQALCVASIYIPCGRSSACRVSTAFEREVSCLTCDALS